MISMIFLDRGRWIDAVRGLRKRLMKSQREADPTESFFKFF
jgi:hypothetical protein